MGAKAGGPCSRKRKSAALDASLDAAAAVEGRGPEVTAEDQEPPLDAAEGSGAGDRISGLPDGVLGDIVSLLPTREGARTQILASRWRHLWRSAPLNLNHHWICDDKGELDTVVSRVLAAHPGPGRRFCVPLRHPLRHLRLQPPSASCHLPDSTTQALRFPKLKKLGLERVSISEPALHAMIAACPTLECLLIENSSGFRCLRINSISLRGIGWKVYSHRKELKFRELIIENAPRLERLLELGLTTDVLHISVISAPKLETLGRLSFVCRTTLVFDSTVIQGLRVDSLMTTMRTVKILALHMHALSLDGVIDFMGCFPCLEKLYIESTGPGETNLWRRKHQNLIRSLDIRLKTIAWRCYRGIKSHVDFATFFLLNARMLELVTLEVNQNDYNEEFFAQQRKVLQLDMKASGVARLHVTPDASHRYIMDFGVHDLDLADPFKWRYPYEFHALS
ncbi:hypothetical protein VPH35_011598 [Triticum aestivum]